MMDVVRRSGDKIDTQQLAESLGCEVVAISAIKGDGIREAADRAVSAAKARQSLTAVHEFSEEVEGYLGEIEALLTEIPENQKRFYAVKLFERDGKIMEQLGQELDVTGIIA